MTKQYENPNNAAFFFDDGDFLNLDDVSHVAVYRHGSDENDDPHISIFTRGVQDSFCRFPEDLEAEAKRLLDALRTYHSKF